MRITNQTLLKIAGDSIREMAKKDHTVLAAYLYGSMSDDGEPALGGTADVDLVVIHQIPPETPRRFQRLTDDYHLDIRHVDRKLFNAPRELRTDPWLGPAIYHFSILHDPSHFLDFVQAGVRDRFYSAPNVLARAIAFARQGRQSWVSLIESQETAGPQESLAFLTAVSAALNAIASLSGNPFAERRMLQQYFDLASALGQIDLYRDLVALLGGAAVSLEDLRGWLPVWGETFTAAAESAPADSGIHPDRFNYYHSAFQALLETERPADMLWPMLHTWCRAVLALVHQPRLTTAWEQAFGQMGLCGESFKDRLDGLDGYLDTVEERLDTWGEARGVGVYDNL